MSDEFDIFNLDVESMNFHEKEEKRKILYSPAYKDGKDNTYKSIIRFIPNPLDPVNKSISHKYTYWLDEPNISVRGYFDSPASIGEDCPLGKTYWKLKKSESAIDQKNSEKLKRKEQFHSLVYIVKDPQNPELEGSVMIFRYNRTIKGLIDEQKNPDQEMGFSDPVNVFDFFKGKDFFFQVSSKGGYPDYKACKFTPSQKAITIDGKEVERSAEGMKLIKEKILSDIPELSTYDYQPLSQDQLEKVYSYINTLTNDSSHLSKIASQTPKSEEAITDTTEAADSFLNETSDAATDDFSEFGLDTAEDNSKESESTTTANADASDDSDLDEFLSGI